MQQKTVWPVGHIEVRETRGLTVIEFHGETDISAAEPIMPVLDAVTAAVRRTVVVDLTPTTFFDCYGLRFLSRVGQRVKERGGRLLVVCPHPMILRVLHHSDVYDCLTPAPVLEKLLAQ